MHRSVSPPLNRPKRPRYSLRSSSTRFPTPLSIPSPPRPAPASPQSPPADALLLQLQAAVDIPPSTQSADAFEPSIQLAQPTRASYSRPPSFSSSFLSSPSSTPPTPPRLTVVPGTPPALQRLLPPSGIFSKEWLDSIYHERTPTSAARLVLYRRYLGEVEESNADAATLAEEAKCCDDNGDDAEAQKQSGITSEAFTADRTQPLSLSASSASAGPQRAPHTPAASALRSSSLMRAAMESARQRPHSTISLRTPLPRPSLARASPTPLTLPPSSSLASDRSLLPGELDMSWASLPSQVHRLVDTPVDAGNASLTYVTPITQGQSQISIAALHAPSLPSPAPSAAAPVQRRLHADGVALPPHEAGEPAPADASVTAPAWRVTKRKKRASASRAGASDAAPLLALPLPLDSPLLAHPPLEPMASDELLALYERMHRMLICLATRPLPCRCSPYHLRLLLFAHRALHSYARREGVFARRAGLCREPGCTEDVLTWAEGWHEEQQPAPEQSPGAIPRPKSAPHTALCDAAAKHGPLSGSHKGDDEVRGLAVQPASHVSNPSLSGVA